MTKHSYNPVRLREKKDRFSDIQNYTLEYKVFLWTTRIM